MFLVTTLESFARLPEGYGNYSCQTEKGYRNYANEHMLSTSRRLKKTQKYKIGGLMKWYRYDVVVYPSSFIADSSSCVYILPFN